MKDLLKNNLLNNYLEDKKNTRFPTIGALSLFSPTVHPEELVYSNLAAQLYLREPLRWLKFSYFCHVISRPPQTTFYLLSASKYSVQQASRFVETRGTFPDCFNLLRFIVSSKDCSMAHYLISMLWATDIIFYQ